MNKIRQSVWTEKARPYFIFTVVFLVVAVCAFGIFLLNDRTFLRFHNLLNKDSFSQRYMYVFEFKHFLLRKGSGTSPGILTGESIYDIILLCIDR